MDREETIKLIKEELAVTIYTYVEPKIWDKGNHLEIKVQLSIAGDTFYEDSDFVDID